MRVVIVVPSHFLSLCLSDVKNNKTYLKELLQINDVIISLPPCPAEETLETLTDKSDTQSTEHSVTCEI